jgi:hypothetical protein
MRHATRAQRRLVLPQPGDDILTVHGITCSTTRSNHAAARSQRRMKRRCTLISQIHADRRPGGQNLIGKRMRPDSSPNAICVHPRESARICVSYLLQPRPTGPPSSRRPASPFRVSRLSDTACACFSQRSRWPTAPSVTWPASPQRANVLPTRERRPPLRRKRRHRLLVVLRQVGLRLQAQA